ncbi:MAG: hypothetical protein IIU14_00020 [Ruminococcus sp.]|nr:hypothetical protein [Ruminococcus sp.]
MNKITLIICSIVCVALIVLSAVFMGSSSDRVEELFNKTVKTLDSSQSISSLFNDEAKTMSQTLDVDAEALREFYQGKSVEIKNFDIFHETGNIYRAYGEVVTDKGSYFLCVSATGARLMDQLGLKQVIIEDYKNFKKKNIIKKKELGKYEKKAEEFGITIRMRGDKR